MQKYLQHKQISEMSSEASSYQLNFELSGNIIYCIGL